MHFYYTLSSSLSLTPGVTDLWKWFRLGNTNSFKNDSGNFMGERSIMAYSGRPECSLVHFLLFCLTLGYITMLDGFSDPFQFSIVLLCVPAKCSLVLLSCSGQSQPG